MLGIRSKPKLRVKFIILLVSMAVVPLVIAMSITILRIQTAQRENVIELDQKIAQVAAEEIEAFILSQFAILKNIGIVYPELSEDQNTRELLFERFLYRSGDFIQLELVDSEGQEISRKNILEIISPNNLSDKSNTIEFLSVRKSGHYVGPLYILNGKPSFIIAEEIRGADNSFRGAVIAQVNARILQDVVQNISAGGEQGRAYIVNEKGIVIAHPDISQVLLESDFSSFPAVAAAIQEDARISLSAAYTNEANESVLGAGVPIVVSFLNEQNNQLYPNWFVIVEQPASVALQIVFEITRFSTILVGIVLLAAIGVAIVFAARIVGPIEQLHAASKKFGEGLLKHRVIIKTNDELEDLASEFNTMAEKLNTSIADLKSEQRFIEAERNKLEMVLSGISDAVIAVDLNRNVIIFNKAAQDMTGFRKTGALGKPIDTIMKIFDGHKQLDVSVYCPIEENGSEKILFSKESLRMSTSKKGERFMNLIVGQIQGGSSINVGCILTIHDITREYLLEKMKSEFVSIAAHQLRTPLSGIKWALSLFLEGQYGKVSKKQESVLSTTYETNERMITLITDLLDVTRIEEGRFRYKPVYTDVQDIIETAVREIINEHRPKKVKFIFQKTQQKIPKILIDKDAIKLAIRNILENAVEYTNPGGTVTVSTVLLDKHIQISIQDTGIGISERETPHIYSKLYRGQRAIQLSPNRSGLGLFIVKNIVEAHNGETWFESKVGKGTTFYLSLPIP